MSDGYNKMVGNAHNTYAGHGRGEVKYQTLLVHRWYNSIGIINGTQLLQLSGLYQTASSSPQEVINHRTSHHNATRGRYCKSCLIATLLPYTQP